MDDRLNCVLVERDVGVLLEHGQLDVFKQGVEDLRQDSVPGGRVELAVCGGGKHLEQIAQRLFLVDCVFLEHEVGERIQNGEPKSFRHGKTHLFFAWVGRSLGWRLVL